MSSTPQTIIRRTLTALFAATAVALAGTSGASAGTSPGSLDPWAVGMVAQYRDSGSSLDPWAVGLVQQSRETSGLDPWAVTLVRRANGTISSGLQQASVRTPIATTGPAAGFDFDDAALGAGAALVAVFLVGASVFALRRHHTPQAIGS